MWRALFSPPMLITLPIELTNMALTSRTSLGYRTYLIFQESRAYRCGFFSVKWHVYMYEDAHLLLKMRNFIQENMPFWAFTACLSV